MLDGVKVLSFTHFVQGPSAVQILADLGADVVKIEPPRGAWERHWAGCNAYLNDCSVLFLLVNRNQRSLAIDIRSERGKQIIVDLLKQSDVLVENFRPGVLERLGFGYEEVYKLNPRIIYASLTGYGSSGPYRDRPGQDLLIQAVSGLCSITGSSDTPPTPIGTSVVDQHAATIGALGVLAALLERERTEVGKKVESNLLNAALDLQIEPLSYYLNKGSLWERSKTGIATTYHQAPYGVYKTSDGWLVISHASMDELKMACDDSRLNAYTDHDQFEKRDEFNSIIHEIVKQKSSAEWAEIFETHGIWYAPVNDYNTIVHDEQVLWNKMIMSVEHPDVGLVQLMNHPVRYNGEPPRPTHQYPPRLGEHTGQILAELGLSEDEIQSLQNDGVVVMHSSEASSMP